VVHHIHQILEDDSDSTLGKLNFQQLEVVDAIVGTEHSAESAVASIASSVDSVASFAPTY
jgi:hypothetical protein